MLILNFAHPFTDAQRARLTELIGGPIERVVDVRTQFDQQMTFLESVKVLIEQVGLSPEQWQTTPLLVNPPSLSPIACLLLAELHGRMGYFPSIVRLRPVLNSTPPSFEVAEIVNLQTVREEARRRR